MQRDLDFAKSSPLAGISLFDHSLKFFGIVPMICFIGHTFCLLLLIQDYRELYQISQGRVRIFRSRYNTYISISLKHGFDTVDNVS